MGKLFFVIVVLKRTVYWQPLNSLYLGDFKSLVGVASTKVFFRIIHAEMFALNLSTT